MGHLASTASSAGSAPESAANEWPASWLTPTWWACIHARSGAEAASTWRPAPDLLKRNFSAAAPNERRVADITEFMTGEGKLFLAGVRDLYGRGLVGWSNGQPPDQRTRDRSGVDGGGSKRAR